MDDEDFTCQKCESDSIMRIKAKCNDICILRVGNQEYMGYVPFNLGIGGGDYVQINVCTSCGQVQGNFPIAKTKLENVFKRRKQT